MWDLIVSVPDHCLSFYFDSKLVRIITVTRDRGKWRLYFRNAWSRIYSAVHGQLFGKSLA